MTTTRIEDDVSGLRAVPSSGRAARLTLVAAMLGFFVVTLDAVIVNVALPQIRADLGGGISGLQWVVDGYTLIFAALLLAAGSLTDRIGAKRTFGAGLMFFVLASAACGAATGLGMLVACRVVQGAAAAAMMPASMALIGQAYPNPARRARAIAAWAMGGAIASSSGPVLGGLLTLASWRWIFLVNLPAGAAALFALSFSWRSLHHAVRFDWAGQVTGLLAIGGLTYAAIEAGEAGFGDPLVLTASAITVAALAAFVATQARGANPMIPPDLFRSRVVVGVNVIGFAFMVGYYGLPFVMSLFLQQERGLSALTTGTVFLPMMLVGLVLTPLVPRITARVGVRPVVVTGLLLMGLGLTAIAFTPPSAPVAVFALLMVLVGLAGPTVMPPIMAALLGAVPERRAGTAGGVLNTSRQVGGALAVAVFGGLLAGPAGFVTGERISLVIAAVVAALAAMVGISFLRKEFTHV